MNRTHALMAAASIGTLVASCAPAAAPTSILTPAAATNLVDRHFEAINERDTARLKTRAEDVYAENIAFHDPGEDAHGRAALTATMEKLHGRFPGAVFERDGAIQDRHGLLRVGWTLGRPGEAPLHRGEDIMRVEGDHVAEVWVFIQPEPSAALP